MVVTLRPATADIWVWQERTGWPSRWTVQAPHSAMPHPNLVPVMPSESRNAQSRGILGLTLMVAGLPLSVNLISAIRKLSYGKNGCTRDGRELSVKGYHMGRAMADILHQFPIKGSAQRVFDAVSRPAGLDAWWTKRSSGEPRARR